MIERYFTSYDLGMRSGFCFTLIGAVICAVLIIENNVWWNRKIKLLKKHAYKRSVVEDPNLGAGLLYEWHDCHGNRILESNLDKISYIELKEWVK